MMPPAPATNAVPGFMGRSQLPQAVIFVKLNDD